MAYQKKPTQKNKSVIVRNSELTKTRTESGESKYSKFKLLIAKIFRLEVKDLSQYLFRISYYKGSLKANDIVCNMDGIVFLVYKSQNGVAMIVSKDFLSSKPNVRGKLIIIDKLKTQK